MQQHDLLLCDHFVSDPNSLQYRFSNKAAGRYNLIDYFVVSRQLYENVQDCIIIDSPINMSDHNPIELLISDCIDMSSSLDSFNEENNVNLPHKVLRWDHSN